MVSEAAFPDCAAAPAARRGSELRPLSREACRKRLWCLTRVAGDPMTTSKNISSSVVCVLGAFLAMPVANGQDSSSVPAAEQQVNLYAVEIKTGSAWDSSKRPNEQLYFREHSANLKRLHDQGTLVLGARYSDKGLV